jgi:hypothetical protein
MDEQRQWHRLFGMSLTDFFAGQPVVVEMEKDLSLKQQLLDVLVVRKAPGPLSCAMPDGFEDLAAHNLISFKSFREALDGWALNELVGHFVNYRKQVSPSVDDLLPEGEFRLFAVCIRFPQKLAGQAQLEKVQEGVYRVRHFSGEARVVVVHQLPLESRNALLHLFSAQAEQVKFAAREYRPRSGDTSSFLYKLYDRYREEGMPMPYTKEEFIRETREKMLRDPEIIEMLRKDPVVVEQVFRDPAVVEQVFRDPAVVERVLGSVSVEDLLKGLPPHTREALLQRLRTGDGAPDQP